MKDLKPHNFDHTKHTQEENEVLNTKFTWLEELLMKPIDWLVKVTEDDEDIDNQ